MIAIHWFRRDLRFDDNTALYHALEGELPVLPVFIFDTNILSELPPDDARVTFIHLQLQNIDQQLRKRGSGIKVLIGDPVNIWKELVSKYPVGAVYYNRDYEPYAKERDKTVTQILNDHRIAVHECKDQVIFEKDEAIKDDGNPYTVFTPYKRKWLERFKHAKPKINISPGWSNFYNHQSPFPPIDKVGFRKSEIEVKDYNLAQLPGYPKVRNFPAEDGTTHLGPHLRFGTVSIRRIIHALIPEDEVFLSELIWREFFMQFLDNFPRTVKENFKPRYNGIRWRNDENEFENWQQGKTGFPLVDAGMRQLIKTGTMHNRVRMVVAGFLCKHLLIDWRWGEAYFAKKLLDYELSSNNGNWQWAAGTGCDAAPYFRIFNPIEQQKKFDPDFKYIKKWIPEYGTNDYPEPIVDHKFARERALETYKKGMMVS